MKYIVIYSIKNETINKDWIKKEISKVLELINIRISKIIKEKLLLRKRLLSRINKLEKLNHINDYKLISYNNNKNSMIQKSILSKLIIRLLENIINGVDLKSKGVKVSNSGGSIIISKPVIKENLNEVKIEFYYFLPNNKTYRYFDRINMFLNKVSKNYKELLENSNNKSYKKEWFMLQDKNLISNIFNNIIINRNNVKYIDNNVNNLIKNLNKNYNNKDLLLLKNSLRKNLNDISNLPSKWLINSTILNIENQLLNNKNKELNSNNEILNILKKNNINNEIIINNKIFLKNEKNESLNLISNSCNLHTSVSKLERKDLVLNYLLKNDIKGLNNIINKDSNKNILLNNNVISKNDINISDYMISYIDILLGNIINKNGKSNDIKMIISKYFGLKEVSISGINLKYEFNNPEILLKLIRKGISKRKRTLSRIFRFRLKNRIPTQSVGILKNKISNNLLKSISLNNNILNVEHNIKKVLFNSVNINNDISIYNDIKDYYNNLDIDNNLTLNNDLLYKNIVGWSLLLKGKVGARKGKNRSNRILMTKGSFKNNNILIYNIFDDSSNNNGYSKDRLKLNYIKNSNFISYMDKSTNNGKLGITLKVNIL